MENDKIEEKALNLAPLDHHTREIAQQILDEQDVDRVKDLTTLFNLNAQKRNVMRVIKMNELLDTVTDKVIERFEKCPDNFSNDDLIKYMQVTENAIDKANKNLHLVEETPPIQLMQNNQVNINIENSLDKESRERVLETVRSILSKNVSNSSETAEVIDYVENKGIDDNDTE